MAEEWPPEIVKLSQIIGKERIEKYIGYLDNHDALLENNGIDLTSNIGGVLLKSDLENLCNADMRSLPLIDPVNGDDFQAAGTGGERIWAVWCSPLYLSPPREGFLPSHTSASLLRTAFLRKTEICGPGTGRSGPNSR